VASSPGNGYPQNVSRLKASHLSGSTLPGLPAAIRSSQPGAALRFAPGYCCLRPSASRTPGEEWPAREVAAECEMHPPSRVRRRPCEPLTHSTTKGIPSPAAGATGHPAVEDELSKIVGAVRAEYLPRSSEEYNTAGAPETVGEAERGNRGLVCLVYWSVGRAGHGGAGFACRLSWLGHATRRIGSSCQPGDDWPPTVASLPKCRRGRRHHLRTRVEWRAGSPLTQLGTILACTGTHAAFPQYDGKL
jgi:hypothetical protein